MQKLRQSRFMPGALLLLIASATPESADAFRVFKVDPFCPDPTAYSTIQAAVDAAAAYSDDDHADYVWIADNTDINGYKNQHIVVNDPESVIIEGGFFDCTDFDPGTDQTSVSGAGNDGGPVFDIIGTGHTVYLGNLFIAGAQRGGGTSGGGINFTGHGELDIAQTTIFNNQAAYGGGINVTPSGGQAVLKLMHDTTIYLNTASVSGGGVRLEGDARLLVLEQKVAINGNHATQYGGGIEVLGPARADIGAPDGGFGGTVIAANSASYGGGVAVLDNGNGEAVLRTFAHDSAHPTTFNQNRADVDGGAIYLTGLADACLYASHFSNNVAEEGAAIYMTYYIADGSGDHDDQGGIYINDSGPARLGTECGPESIAALGGSSSCSVETCGSFTGHVTKHADDTPSAGAVIYTYLNTLLGNHVRIQDSTVASVLASGGGTMDLQTCLITDNATSGDLIAVGQVFPGYTLSLKRCTLANDTFDGDHVIDRGQIGTVALDYVIVDLPGKPAVSDGFGYQEKHLDVGYTIAANAAGLPTSTNPSVRQGSAQFRNVATRDYHLRATSLGVDFAPAIGGSDLDGTPATHDLPQIPNLFGPADLGAYELQNAFACDTSADATFCDGFEP